MNKLDLQYQELLKDIIYNGREKGDRTGTGTLSIFGRQIRHKMSDGYPLLTTKKMAFKTMVTELLWFLRGSTRGDELTREGCHIWDGDMFKKYETYAMDNSYGVDILSMDEFIEQIKTDDKFAVKWGELGPIYGKQWRSWKINLIDPNTMEFVPPIDQIANLINDLKTNPDSRRLMVNAWNVGELEEMTLPPCHYGFQVYTRELSFHERSILAIKAGWKQKYYIDDYEHEDFDKYKIPTRAISLMFNMRSNDVPLGLPFNIASYGLLLEILGKIVNMVPDELIANLGDAHIYKNQIDGVKEQLTREPYNLPKLDIHPGILDYELDKLDVDMFKLVDYQSHPSIKIPLSN